MLYFLNKFCILIEVIYLQIIHNNTIELKHLFLFLEHRNKLKSFKRLLPKLVKRISKEINKKFKVT